MNGFIRLHERSGMTEVLLNASHIVAINDLRSDPIIKGKKGWQWTNVDCSNGSRYQVKETEKEIIELIKELT